MNVVHKKSDNNEETDSSSKAKKLEQEGELDKAAAMFEKLLREDPLNELAYNRLMIIYRKKKDYKKELAIIKKGIAAFEQSFKKSSKAPLSRKITALSKSLLKSLGLTDKKGNMIYTREPVGRWNKRKLVVERMIRKKRKSRS